MHPELVGLVLVLSVLAADSYSDIRYRHLLGRDRHYILVGAAGLAITLFATPTTTDMLGIVAGVTATFLLYRLKAMASGDCAVMLIVSTALPTLWGIPFVPVFVLLGGITLVAAAVVAYNVLLNISQFFYRVDAMRTSTSEHPLKKAAAFVMTHRMRGWEKYVVCIEDKDGRFSLFGDSPHTRHEWTARPGQLVMVAAPVIPFLLAALLLLVAVRLFFVL